MFRPSVNTFVWNKSLWDNLNMPKIVDHEKQKQKVAEAVWRVILRDGIERASVRNIAEEAGISPGQLRYYFSTQSELFEFSMKLVAENVKKRISNKHVTGGPMEAAWAFLSEVLPLDETRRAEMEVWLAFHSKALVDETLKSLSEKVYAQMAGGIRHFLDQLMQRGVLRQDLDAAKESKRLHALIDGLAIHGIMFPGALTADDMRNIIICHLESLA